MFSENLKVFEGIDMKSNAQYILKVILTITAVSLALPGFLMGAESESEKESSVAGNEQEKAFDLDAPPSTPTKIAPYTYFGGYIRFEFEDERNFDLDSSEADTLTIIEPIVSLATTIRPNEDFEAFFNLRYSKEAELEEEGKNDRYRPHRLRISQAYLSFNKIFEKTSLKIGRQRFDDDREWLYDEKLDAVRVFHKLGEVKLDGSLSWEGTFDMDLLSNRNDKRVNNYFLRAECYPAKKIKFAPYFVYRDDRSHQWSRPLFLGIHSSGEISKKMDYWAELAWVRGREKKIEDNSSRTFDFEGIGFDVGATYKFDSPLKPSIVAGFAFGSGDSNPDGDDRGFRQTGLQDNSGKLTGITSVDYYGELFDPELSNMMIFTLGGGIQPQKNLSFEVIYHYYLQHHAADEIRDADVDSDPTGLSRDLGSEIDFVLGYRHLKKLDIKAAFGMFLPGDAFPSESDDPAYCLKIRLRYKF